jgi:uncharacterized protein (UPF0212 family)
MNHPTAPTLTWTCFACGNRREVPCEHVGHGIPACPKCRTPMEPVREAAEPALIPGLAEALSKRDADDPVTFAGGMGEP